MWHHFRYHENESNVHQLSHLFQRPPPTDISWNQLLQLIETAGVEVRSLGKSRVALIHADAVMIVHRPAQLALTVRATVRDIAAFLRSQGLGVDAPGEPPAAYNMTWCGHDGARANLSGHPDGGLEWVAENGSPRRGRPEGVAQKGSFATSG